MNVIEVLCDDEVVGTCRFDITKQIGKEAIY